MSERLKEAERQMDALWLAVIGPSIHPEIARVKNEFLRGAYKILAALANPEEPR